MSIELMAISISIFSLILSVYTAYRDRPNLAIQLKQYDWSPIGAPPKIVLNVVNKGRRTVVLKSFGGDGPRKGTFVSESLGENGKGLRLDELSFYELTLTLDDIYADQCIQYDGFRFVRLWLTDSTGKKYFVRRSKKAINRLISEHEKGPSIPHI